MLCTGSQTGEVGKDPGQLVHGGSTKLGSHGDRLCYVFSNLDFIWIDKKPYRRLCITGRLRR